ncbi:MAG: maleylpyruvate isomerase family mycothiol-dependent enzyme [Ilumatobacteraceae bacterium]
MVPTSTLSELFATWTSIGDLCAPLTEEQWKTPTACPGWSVQDNVSHLIGIERGMTGMKTTEHQSEPREYVKNAIGQSNENEVDSRRSLTGAQVLNEWNEIVKLRTTALYAADESYFATAAKTPLGPGSVADFLQLRVLDCWIHEQDIRRALSVPGHESGPAAESTIDRLLRTLPMVIGKRAATPEGESVNFQVTGPIVRSLFMTVTSGRAAVVDTHPTKVRVTFSTDSNTFVALATGRITADAANSNWSATGDKDLGLRIAQNLNMMI